MGSIKMEKIYGGQPGEGDRYLGGSEEIGSYSNPVNNTKSSELTDEENDIKIYMTTPSFISAKRGYKEKEDLMAYLGRRKKATSDFVNGLEERKDAFSGYFSKASLGRQIMDAEEILDSGMQNGEPLDNETEMLVQQELDRLKQLYIDNHGYTGIMATANPNLKKEKVIKFLKKSLEEMDINDPVLIKMRAAKMKANQPKKSINPNYKAVKNASKIEFLKKEREQLMRDMEQEAEPEGGPIADEYGDKLNRIDKAIAKLEGRKEMTYNQAIAEEMEASEFLDTVNNEFDLETLELMQGAIEKRMLFLKKMMDVANPPPVVKGFMKDRVDEIAETIKLGLQLNEKELCPKGKAYIKRRKAAGEKSSAYLSGRAVKVCKGQMSGTKKKKK